MSPASRRAVEVGEAFADGTADRCQLGRARKKANAAAGRECRKAHPNPTAAHLANYVCLQDYNLSRFLHLPSGYFRQLRPQAGLLRDVLGNPFRPAAIAPSLLTSTVVSLAEGIYADRAFDRLPILADALEDAGCDDPDLLGHCRGPGPHVLGCWVIDLVLGKG
jgi:hypothetical protein